eukprot:jgi/Botrbrau1/13956/Bobra.250_1s0010.1
MDYFKWGGTECFLAGMSEGILPVLFRLLRAPEGTPIQAMCELLRVKQQMRLGLGSLAQCRDKEVVEQALRCELLEHIKSAFYSGIREMQLLADTLVRDLAGSPDTRERMREAGMWPTLPLEFAESSDSSLLRLFVESLHQMTQSAPAAAAELAGLGILQRLSASVARISVAKPGPGQMLREVIFLLERRWRDAGYFLGVGERATPAKTAMKEASTGPPGAGHATAVGPPAASASQRDSLRRGGDADMSNIAGLDILGYLLGVGERKPPTKTAMKEASKGPPGAGHATAVGPPQRDSLRRGGDADMSNFAGDGTLLPKTAHEGPIRSGPAREGPRSPEDPPGRNRASRACEGANPLAGRDAPRRDAGQKARRQRGLACAQCGKASGGDVKLMDCAGCRSVQYCGRDCQKSHWPSHKAACKAKQAVAAPSP